MLRLVDQAYEYPLEVVEESQYQAIALKTLESLYPSLVCYEPTYPKGTLTVWTVPQQANGLGLLPWVPLTQLRQS